MRPNMLLISSKSILFQSTHPLRDATKEEWSIIWILLISIHAPLTGCDAKKIKERQRERDFNPRTPYGMRLSVNEYKGVINYISIHAPLTGCDSLGIRNRGVKTNFNPRTPYGMRHRWFDYQSSWYRYFNPRTPYGMRPNWSNYQWMSRPISIHAPLTGCDVVLGAYNFDTTKFQSTHPLRDATRELKQDIDELQIFQSTHPLRDATKE